MRCAALTFAALAAVTPLAAHAQTAAEKADARCILVLNLAGAQNTQNAAQREKATEGVFFYLGKLNARGASARLGALLVGEAGGFTTAQQAQTELTRCSNELNARAVELRNGLTQLQQVGRAKAAAAAAAKPAAPPAPK